MEILRSVENRIAQITLNRPEKRNALNPQLIKELTSAFKEADADPDVKVIILKANGPDFSAGADLAYLHALQNQSYEKNLKDSLQLKDLFLRMYTLSKPLIAQVEGQAIAGGCGLVSACDVVFATPDAMFGYTEVRIGFVPALVASFINRKIGAGRGREMLISGELISAEVARDYGLVNFISEKEEIEKVVRSYGGNMVEKTSAESIRITKQLLLKIDSMPLDESLNYAARVNAEARLNADCKKGIAAFLEKRHPKW